MRIFLAHDQLHRIVERGCTHFKFLEFDFYDFAFRHDTFLKGLLWLPNVNCSIPGGFMHIWLFYQCFSSTMILYI